MASVTRQRRLTRAERQELKRQELRADLLRAVEAILEEGGSYTELRVEQLFAATGVARTTFYAYYEDKGDLLVALAEDVVGDLLEGLEPWFSLTAGATREDLQVAIQRFVDAYLPHRVILASVAETAPYDRIVREFFEERLDLLTSRLCDHLRAGIESGLVRPGVDPEPTALWLSWLLERGMYQLVGPARLQEPERLVRALTTVVWNALYRQES